VPDGFHLLSLEHPVSGILKRSLRLSSLGDIACDLGETDYLSVVAAYRIDDYMRPKPLAALANASAFALEFAVAARCS
jgi:hypothetical protein